ncbi:MAG: DUF488 domain-containing protein [Roseiflexus sp.]|nr:DUF488 domain-containing protein [Roseiflexus sp.]
MLLRQKVLVAMLREARNRASRIQLMKWAFLFSVETQSHARNACYQFVPYHYGPHSFSLYQEIDALIRHGIIENPGKHGSHWKLTDLADDVALSLPTPVKTDIYYVMKRYGAMSGKQLIELIYEKYPWYTINCKDEVKRRQTRPVADIAIYTIGYERLSVDDFLNRLLMKGIHCVIDVRNNPVSMRYGYHKGTLSRLCSLLGIEYFHFPELGVPGSDRIELAIKDDYDRLFARYAQTTLRDHVEAIQHVAEIVETRPGALMCMEANPASCHRHVLAQALSDMIDLPVIHLEWPR